MLEAKCFIKKTAQHQTGPKGGNWKYVEKFLILNFRHVLIVVSFLLGKSPASVY